MQAKDSEPPGTEYLSEESDLKSTPNSGQLIFSFTENSRAEPKQNYLGSDGTRS